jgi:hypothetical protein
MYHAALNSCGEVGDKEKKSSVEAIGLILVPPTHQGRNISLLCKHAASSGNRTKTGDAKKNSQEIRGLSLTGRLLLFVPAEVTLLPDGLFKI